MDNRKGIQPIKTSVQKPLGWWLINQTCLLQTKDVYSACPKRIIGVRNYVVITVFIALVFLLYF